MPESSRNFDEIKIRKMNSVEIGRFRPVQYYLAEISNDSLQEHAWDTHLKLEN